MKKWLSLLCALIMVLSMLPAAIASADEMVTIKYVIPGSEKEDYATVIKAVNAKLAADLGIQVELVYIPWDVWNQKLNLMLENGLGIYAASLNEADYLAVTSQKKNQKGCVTVYNANMEKIF